MTNERGEMPSDLNDQMKIISRSWTLLEDKMSGQAIEVGFESCYRLMIERETKLNDEIKNLKSIISKELSENDEFGAEYVITTILKEREAKLRKEIELLRLYGNKDCTAMADEEIAKYMEAGND